MRRIALITGANGQLGKSFYEEMKRRYGDTVDVLLLQRSHPEYSLRQQDRVIQADAIRDVDRIVSEIKSFDFRGYDEAYFIHAIGAFETEGPLAKHKLSQEQLRERMETSNVKTFENTFRPFLNKVGKKIPLHVVGFGSTSERLDNTFWNSFLESKKHLQEKLRALSNEFSANSTLKCTTPDF